LASIPSARKPPPKSKLKTWRIVLVLIVAVSAALGVTIYAEFPRGPQCGNSFVGCGPLDEPVILNAVVSDQSYGTTGCCVVTQGYPKAIVCRVTIIAGDTGTIIMNLTSEGGNSFVAFGTYSSETQYVQFAPNYSCLYTSYPPDHNTARCQVLTTGSTYRFDFTVSLGFNGSAVHRFDNRGNQDMLLALVPTLSSKQRGSK